jgi:hypothetical protein
LYFWTDAARPGTFLPFNSDEKRLAQKKFQPSAEQTLARLAWDKHNLRNGLDSNISGLTRPGPERLLLFPTQTMLQRRSKIPTAQRKRPARDFCGTGTITQRP